jgi:hypothetical protein
MGLGSGVRPSVRARGSGATTSGRARPTPAPTTEVPAPADVGRTSLAAALWAYREPRSHERGSVRPGSPVTLSRVAWSPFAF